MRIRFSIILKAVTVFLAALMFLTSCGVPAAANPTQQPSGISTESAITPSPSPSPEAEATQSPAVSSSPVSSPAPGESKMQPSPLFYEVNGKVFIASGMKTLCLGNASDLYNYGDASDPYTYNKSLNCQTSEDGRYVYYISYNGNDSAGDLMKVAADASSAPERIAENVCAAEISGDGRKILYITSTDGISKPLYLKDGDGEPEKIAENIILQDYGFSPGGQCIYYFVQEKKDVELYIKKGKNKPALVIKADGSDYISDGAIRECIDVAAVDDGGNVLYEAYDDSKGYQQTFLYSSGRSKRICDSGGLIMSLGSADEYLFVEGGEDEESLWYKAPGKKPVLVTVKLNDFTFPDWGYSPYIGDNKDRDFIFSRYEASNDIYVNVKLYEQQIGEKKIPIDMASGNHAFGESPAGNCVIYSKDGPTYAARKTENGWSAGELSKNELVDKICYDEPNYFDSSGHSLYYIDNESDGPGPLLRYSIDTGQKVSILDGVSTVTVYGDTAYAIDADGTAYRIENDKPIKLADNINSIMGGDGGVYLITENNDILFVADGADSTQKLCGGITYFYSCSTSPITYYPPMEEDSNEASTILINDAHYYLCQLDSAEYGEYKDFYTSPVLTLEKDISLSKALANYSDNSNSNSNRDSDSDSDSDVFPLYPMLNEGFTDYSLWLKTKDKKYKNAAIASFKAINEYYSMEDDTAQGGE